MVKCCWILLNGYCSLFQGQLHFSSWQNHSNIYIVEASVMNSKIKDALWLALIAGLFCNYKLDFALLGYCLCHFCKESNTINKKQAHPLASTPLLKKLCSFFLVHVLGCSQDQEWGSILIAKKWHVSSKQYV